MWCVLVTLFISCSLCSPGRYSCSGRRFPPRLRPLPCRQGDTHFPFEPDVHCHSCSSFSAPTRTHATGACRWRWGWGLNPAHWSSVCNKHACCRVRLPHAAAGASCCSQNDGTACERRSDRPRPLSLDEQRKSRRGIWPSVLHTGNINSVIKVYDYETYFSLCNTLITDNNTLQKTWLVWFQPSKQKLTV